MNLKLSNTISRKKEPFVAQSLTYVTMYVCGITPYSYSHIGHARVYVTFDILHRLLKVLGKKVTYIRNFTDIDDKILDRIPLPHTQIEEKITQFVQPFIADFHSGLQKLNCLPVSHEPRVTQTIPEIIELVEQLIAKKHAYVVGNDVYYDIASFSAYGKLSGHPLENLLAGSRVDVADGKKNPGDFALWKGNSDGLYWSSPWGYGRPGWHIECSAMVGKYAKTLDIHGGGADLMFPHHENECAQSEAGFGYPLASYWMHVEFLLMNKEKMSKSLGNVLLMKDVLEKNKPMAFRFLMLQHGYNKPLSYSDDDLAAAEKAFDRLNDLFWRVESISDIDFMQAVLEQDIPFISQAFAAIEDDLGSAKAIALIFEHISEIKNSPEARKLTKALCEQVLGLKFEEPKEQEISDEIKTLIEQREIARKEKNWVQADQIRAQLVALGYDVKDKKL
ncbi:cysteine--tRNA ligase [Candidatus Dependentiae bacterium]|nr:cysteine--tRNA ligase [Candidatus Dependentiae bacterium]